MTESSNCNSFVSSNACIVQGVAASIDTTIRQQQQQQQQQQQMLQQVQTNQTRIVCSTSLDADDDVQIVGASHAGQRQANAAPIAAVFCSGDAASQGSLPVAMQTKPVQVVQPTLSHQVTGGKSGQSAAALQPRVMTAVPAAGSAVAFSASSSSNVSIGAGDASLGIGGSQPMQLQQNFNILNFNYPSTLLQMPDGRLFLQQPSNAGQFQFVKLPAMAAASAAATGKPQQIIAASTAAVQVSSSAPTQAFITQTPSGGQQVHFLAAPITPQQQQQLHQQQLFQQQQQQQQLQQQQLLQQQQQQQQQQLLQQTQQQQPQQPQQQQPTLDHLKRMLPGVKDVAESNGRIVLTTKQDRVISMKRDEFNLFYNLTVQVDALQKTTSKTPQVEEELRKLRQMQNDVIKQANKMHQVIEQQQQQQQQQTTEQISASTSSTTTAECGADADSFVLAEPKYGEIKVLVEYRVEGARYQLRLTQSQKSQLDDAIVRLGNVVERERLLKQLLAKQQQQQQQQQTQQQTVMATRIVALPTGQQQQQQQQQMLAQSTARGQPTAVVVTALPQQQQQQQQQAQLPSLQHQPSPPPTAQQPQQQQAPAPAAPTRSQIRASRIHRQIQVEHRTLLSHLRPDAFRTADEATANLLRFHLFQDVEEVAADGGDCLDGDSEFSKLSHSAWAAMEARFKRLQAGILMAELRTRVQASAEPELQLLSDQLAVSAARQQLDAERARPAGQVTPLVFDDAGRGRPASPKRPRLQLLADDGGAGESVDNAGQTGAIDAAAADVPIAQDVDDNLDEVDEDADDDDGEFREVSAKEASAKLAASSTAAAVATSANGNCSAMIHGSPSDFPVADDDAEDDDNDVDERLGGTGAGRCGDSLSALNSGAGVAGDDEASAAIASIL